MNYNNRKGQAAMEFLMTYGWAILAAIVVIAVLAIYFRPSSIVSNTAVVSAPFYVNAFTLNENDNVVIELKNNGGEDLQDITVDAELQQPAPINCGVSASANMSAGDTTPLTMTCAGLDSGEAVSGTLTISYKRLGSSLTLTSTGSITGKVP